MIEILLYSSEYKLVEWPESKVWLMLVIIIINILIIIMYEIVIIIELVFSIITATDQFLQQYYIFKVILAINRRIILFYSLIKTYWPIIILMLIWTSIIAVVINLYLSKLSINCLHIILITIQAKPKHLNPLLVKIRPQILSPNLFMKTLPLPQ